MDNPEKIGSYRQFLFVQLQFNIGGGHIISWYITHIWFPSYPGQRPVCVKETLVMVLKGSTVKGSKRIRHFSKRGDLPTDVLGSLKAHRSFEVIGAKSWFEFHNIPYF